MTYVLKPIVMFFMDASKELHLKNKSYKGDVELYIMEAYLEDVNKGDITTKYFVPKKRKKITAEIVTNTSGIFAGVQEAEWFLKRVGIKIIKRSKDGAIIKAGQVVMKIEGSAEKILKAERTLLNLLQRMSGVATSTNKLVSKLSKNIKLLATRKTLWGMLDKRAVTVGGGGTHRLNLSDAILIKDNHLSLTTNLEKSLKKVFKKVNKVRFIEIELENSEEINKFLEIYEKLKSKITNKNIVVMLDNFKPAEIKKVLPKLKKAGLTIELSGGINERNIKSYNIKGISAISSGSITMASPNLDISLNIK